MSDDVWGPWIEHDGKGRPVSSGTVCEVLRGNGEISVVMAGCSKYSTKTDAEYIRARKSLGAPGWWVWSYDKPKYGEIVRYRIRKPRGLTMLEEIAKGVREPVDA